MSLPALLSKANHVSPLTVFSRPWETLPPHPKPENPSKWAVNPLTQWHFLSAFEGGDCGKRVEGDNPAVYLHGVVADYDFKKGKPVTVERVREEVAKSPHLPTMFHITKSGGARVIWLFEKRVGLWPELTQPLLKVLAERLRLGDLLPHWDKGAFFQPSTYYEWVSEGFEMVSGETLPNHMVQAWVIEASTKEKREWGGQIIPLAEVEKLIQKRVADGKWGHPHLPPVGLVVGKRCRRFWDPEASDDTAAVILDWGIHHFSDGGGGMTWPQILGRDAMLRAGDEALGAAVEHAYFENSKGIYWIKEPDDTGQSQWRDYKADAFKRYLKISRGLSDVVRKGEATSDVDRALNFIEQKRAITGTMVEVFSSRESFVDGGLRWLNISGREVLKPDSRGLGEVMLDERFQWFLSLTKDLLISEQVQDHFMAWTRNFYRGAYQKRLGFGQAVYLIGPVGTGKSLLVKILEIMVGGKTRGAQVLTGDTAFNAHLFKAGLVIVDDEIEANAANRMMMVQKMKALVANSDQSSHGKNQMPCETRWRGRVIVTANDDAVSSQLIPDLRAGIRDKINLYRTGGIPCSGRSDEDLHAIASMWAKWLVETEDADHIVKNPRFGIASYADERLASTSADESPEEQLIQLLDHVMAVGNLKELCGTSMDLLGQLVQNSDEHLQDVIAKEWTTGKVGKALGRLADKPGSRVSKAKLKDGYAKWCVKQVEEK